MNTYIRKITYENRQKETTYKKQYFVNKLSSLFRSPITVVTIFVQKRKHTHEQKKITQ